MKFPFFSFSRGEAKARSIFAESLFPSPPPRLLVYAETTGDALSNEGVRARSGPVDAVADDGRRTCMRRRRALIGLRETVVLAENVLTMSGHSAGLRAESVEKAARCVLETNRGEVLEYTPGDREIRGDIDHIDYSKSNGTCSVSIRGANSTHAGVWLMTAYAEELRTEQHGRKKTDIHDDNSTAAAKAFAFNLYVQVNLALHRARSRPVPSPTLLSGGCATTVRRRSAKLVAASN